MNKHSKRYKKALELVDPKNVYNLSDAVEILKKMVQVRFDASIEGHFRIGHKNTQDIRGYVQLPHGTGRAVKVLVFAKGEQVDAAKKAGADYVGDKDLIERIKSGWFDYNFVVSTPDTMKDVGTLGPILGKRGLMPKPANGTVTMDVAPVIKQLKAGRVEYRANKAGVVNLLMGKLSFDQEKIVENASHTFQTLLKDKPSDAKGDYIQTFYLSSTMSPGIKIMTRALRN